MFSAVAGADMSDFFNRYVRGVESPPYAEAFAYAGLRFVREPQQPVWIGVGADENDPNNFKVAVVRPGSPAADAGLEIGDVIRTFRGIKITSDQLFKTGGRFKTSEPVAVTLQRGRRTMQMSI